MFESTRHPRDSRGRFATTGVSRGDAVHIARQVNRLMMQADESHSIRQARIELLAELSREQRGRLASVHKPTKVVPHRLQGRARLSRKANRVEISEHGATAHLQPHDPSFAVKYNTKHKYSVPTDTGDVVLNRHHTEIHFKGEVVKGVPDFIGDVGKASNDTLVKGLAEAVKGSKKGSSPQWNLKHHGQPVTDPKLIGKHGYEEMQLHHVNQWVKDPAHKIESDYKAGRITEAQRRHRHYSQIEQVTNPENGETNYQLKLAPKGSRAFVVLPGGLHQGGTPLYFANHPRFLHPKTGELARVGIPKYGDSSREWFENEFRRQYWKEYYKHHIGLMTKELHNRIKNGRIDSIAAQKLYQETLTKES